MGLCDECLFVRNCVNGLWCERSKTYVEHRNIENCNNYEPEYV